MKCRLGDRIKDGEFKYMGKKAVKINQMLYDALYKGNRSLEDALRNAKGIHEK